jgi:rare lipoprotein A (peptidoglycan hydrolase)
MVRINDRGPNVRRKAPRILDVSRDAATLLGITKCGIAKIKIEELASDQPAA